MSKYIADILRIEPKQLHSQIEYLERITRQPGVDIKLSAELKSRDLSMLRDLHLDADDSSELEVYNALKSKLRIDDSLLAKKLNANGVNFQHHVVDYVSKKIKPSGCWAIKKTVLRNILKTNPPTQLAKKFKI